MRRKQKSGPASPSMEIPPWLFRFRFGEWSKGATPESPNAEQLGKPYQGDIRAYHEARLRWHDAIEAWLVEHDLFMQGHRYPPGGYQAFKQFAKAEPHRVVNPDHHIAPDAPDEDDVRDRFRTVQGGST